MKHRSFIVFVSLVAVALLTLPALCQDVKTYTVNKVSGSPPTIDGSYTENEWAGSTWTDEFYGLDLDPNAAEFKGARVDSVVKIQWRALWDEDYLYLLITEDAKYLNPNGQVWDVNTGAEIDLSDQTQILTADDVGYAGWGAGTNIDFEAFLVTNWTADLGNAENPASSTGGPANYQVCYFPIKAGKNAAGDPTPSNFGTRGASGPPFFYSGYTGDSTMRPGALVVADDPTTTTVGVDWQPITDSTVAQQKGVKPFLLAAQPHEVAGAKLGTDVVAKPVLEMAFPFSQFTSIGCNVTLTTTNPDTGDVTTVKRNPTDAENPPDGAYALLKKDAQGHWVKAGAQWLINICAYTDGITSANDGVSYITWNQLNTGGFHNWPRGIMTFAAPVSVGEWMLH